MLLDAHSKPIEKKMTTGNLVIFVSPDGESWKPVKSEDVPAWVKHPDILGAMVAGEMVNDPAVAPEWYRAEKLPADVH